MNQLKLAIRCLYRQKFSSLINIFGLAMGIGSFILIAVYVYNEYRFDRFHEHRDTVYRLNSNIFNPNTHGAIVPLPFYPVIKDNVPEVEEVVRVQGAYGAPMFAYNDLKLRDPDVLFADPEFLTVFSFGLADGSLEAFDEDVNSIFVSREFANRFFGQENPIGQVIRYFDALPLVVRGVLDDVPEHSHLQFSAIINIEFLRTFGPMPFESWNSHTTTFYLRVQDGTDIAMLENKLLELYAEAANIDLSDGLRRLHLQPLHNVYLGSGDISSPTVPVLAGSQFAVYIFSISAVLILLLACLNYVNLASAKSAMRAREVGVRKVLGAGQMSLVRKFLGESLLVVLISMLVGGALVELVFPHFSAFSGKEIGFFSIPTAVLFVSLAALLLVVTILAGIYPAFVISRFQPVTVLKGSSALISRQLQGRSGPSFRFRQLLIVFQFAISTGLIICSLILYSQTRHALTTSGFERESLLVMQNLPGEEMTNRYHAIRADLEQYPFVRKISAGNHVPTERIGYMTRLREPHLSMEESLPVFINYVDFGYFETIGAPISSGRSFQPEYATDSTETVVLNRTAASYLGIQEADGAYLAGFPDGELKRVIGIVEDIHFRSVLEKVNPKAFYIQHNHMTMPPASFQILVKFDTDDQSLVSGAVEAAWKKHGPEGEPADFFFMDSRYESLYNDELQTGKVALIFTFLAILIAALGLMGTTVYVMEARKKELGIRKVLGATVARLSAMVSREFTMLIILANLIAWPLTFYLMSRWLDQFAYRTEVTIWVFLLAGLTGLLLALGIVNGLMMKQVSQNPVNALKYE